MTTTCEDELKEPPAQGPSKRPTKEQARQGQNIRGMLAVMFVSIALVVVGFLVVVMSSRQDAPVSSPTPAEQAEGAPGPAPSNR